MKEYKIIDAHCHIYPDAIAQKAAAATGHFYGIDMKYDGRVSTLIDICKRADICRCLVHSVATTPHQVSSINRFIANTVSENPERFIGFGALHPDSEDVERDVEEIISLGLCGVKLHPDIQGFFADDEKCNKIYRAIEGKLPLLIHAGDERYKMSDPERIAKVAKAYPKLTLIAAHFGGYSQWEKARECLSPLPNVFVDTSSSLTFLTDEKILEYIDAYGEDKVMFGTDYPMWEAQDEISRILSLGLSEETLEKIFHFTLERLLGR